MPRPKGSKNKPKLNKLELLTKSLSKKFFS